MLRGGLRAQTRDPPPPTPSGRCLPDLFRRPEQPLALNGARYAGEIVVAHSSCIARLRTRTVSGETPIRRYWIRTRRGQDLKISRYTVSL